jgi:hypothetical protein
MNKKLCTLALTVLFSSTLIIAGENDELMLPPAKKLNCSTMDMLNTVFKDSPIGLLHMEIAHNTGIKVMKELIHGPTNPEFITQQVKRLIKPIEGFFDKIKAFSNILKPLLEECLGERQNNKILLLNCFDSQITSAEFFEQNIKTKEELLGMSREFIIFFRDVYESVTPDTRKAYLDLKKRIIEERQAAGRNKSR